MTYVRYLGLLWFGFAICGCSFGLKHVDVNQRSDEQWHEVQRGEITP